MFSAGLTGMAIGPCAAAATFAVTGNAWQIKTLENVILVGHSPCAWSLSAQQSKCAEHRITLVLYVQQLKTLVYGL